MVLLDSTCKCKQTRAIDTVILTFLSVLFFLSSYGASTGITDYSMSFYLVPILNAGSVFGRTVPNAISDKTGTLNLIGPGAVVCSILCFCLIAVNSVAGIVVIAVLFGFFSGVFIALPSVIFAVGIFCLSYIIVSDQVSSSNISCLEIPFGKPEF